MKIKKIAFCMFLSCMFFINHAMEEGYSEDAPQETTIDIIDVQGNRFSVPLYLAKKLNYIQLARPYCDESNGLKIDFQNLTPPENVELTKDILLKVFICIQNEDCISQILNIFENCISQIDEIELLTILTTAHYLEAPSKILEELAICIFKYDEKNPIVAINLPNLHNIIKEFESHSTNFRNFYKQNSSEWDVLDLSHEKLYNLRGLAKIQNLILADVTEIPHFNTLDISYNNITTLDIDKILTVMPHLRYLNACNNKIENLIITKKLPDNFILHLDNNKLKNIPSFKIGHGAQIFVQGNHYLHKSDYQKLEDAIQTSLWDRKKHLFNLREIWKSKTLSLKEFCCFSLLGSITLHQYPTILRLIAARMVPYRILPSLPSFCLGAIYSSLFIGVMGYYKISQKLAIKPSRVWK